MALLSAYFLACGIAGLLTNKWPDRYGRRTTFLVAGALSILCQFWIILVPSYWSRLFAFTCLGALAIKNSVCYLWLLEWVDTKHK